jgi:acetyltransferase
MMLPKATDQEEITAVTRNGVKVKIRPISPDDGPLLLDLFNSLSPRSIYFRFFSPLKSLTQEMLDRFTQIDPNREIALVATKDEMEGKIIGVCRMYIEHNGESAEIAVVVGDDWHGKGVGGKLLERCVSMATARRVKTIWGLVLPENTTMLSLARKMGFTPTWSDDTEAYKLEINLSVQRGDHP